MNSDRELLELAAKAAGYVWREDGRGIVGQPSDTWNPLSNDGDAQRLAVRMGLHVIFCDDNPEHPQVIAVNWSGETKAEYHGTNHYAAARRAITRAAAAATPSVEGLSIYDKETPPVGLFALRDVVRCLRETGRYVDEEGEATNALSDLIDRLSAHEPRAAIGGAT